MINKSILKRRTNSFISRHPAIRSVIPYHQVRKIGILFTTETDEKHNQIKNFEKLLQEDGKEVSVLTFLPKGKDNFEFRYDFFTKKDVSFWGNLNQNIKTFTDKDLDFLFCIDRSVGFLSEVILKRSKAKCRVGCYDEKRSSCFELMIKPGPKTTYEQIIREMIHYVKQLSKEQYA